MVKTITIRDEVHQKLLAIKKENESFSELFERLAEGKNPLETLMKLRGRVEFKEREKMLSQLYPLETEGRP